MNILAMERSPLCHKNMLRHITKLSQDVADCGFPVTRGAHAAVLVALEEGRVSWMEPDARSKRSGETLSQEFTSRLRAPVAHHLLRWQPPSSIQDPRAPRRPTVSVNITIATPVHTRATMCWAMSYTNMCALIAGVAANHTLIRSLPAIRSNRMHLTGLTTPEYKLIDLSMV